MFNRIHKQLRVTIDNCFGLLKGQWRKWKYLDVASMERAKRITETSILQHNLGVDFMSTADQTTTALTTQVPSIAEIDYSAAGHAKRASIAHSLLS